MRHRSIWVAACLAAVGLSGRASAVETVVVTASPLSTEDLQRTPVAVQTLDASDLARLGPPDLLGAMSRDLAGVSLGDAQDNRFQPSLTYRGFEASSLVGDAQGLAVYVDGVRFNQPFGDNVEWSLLPDAAMASVTLEGADPVFGLNALGGELSIALKDGFTAPELEAEGAGGSFGRGEASFAWGDADGGRAAFVSADVLTDDGWRAHSPSALARAFASVAWRNGTSELHFELIGAHGDLTGNGSAPVELLAVQRSAVFTWPDSTHNLFGLATLRGNTQLSDAWSLSGQIYVQALGRGTANGDASDASPCVPANGLLCLDNGDILVDSGGQPIADFLSGAPYAQLNRSRTHTVGYGGAVQTAYAAPGWTAIGGVALDGGDTDFSATSQIGALTADRGFAGPGFVIDQPDQVIAPVRVSARNLYVGLYAKVVADLTPSLSLTAAARENLADIELRDRIGTALSGRHRYGRLDPSSGATYRLTPDVSAYASYAEASRAPTPAEFSCADAAAPCSLTNFFVGDPPLKQVVARTLEAGFRGRTLGVAWQADLWRTDTADDIVFSASSVLGRAYFRNIGATRREGLEAGAHWRGGRWSLDFGYSYTRATFQSPVTLESPDNPLADASGRIFVRPGNRLAGVPEHLAKLSLGFAATEDLSLTLAGRYASGVYLLGDEANLTAPTAAYAVFDLGARYRLSGGVEIFATIDNLFDRKYATFGTFSPTADVPIAQAPGASDPRSLSPAPPRSVLVGVRLHA